MNDIKLEEVVTHLIKLFLFTSKYGYENLVSSIFNFEGDVIDEDIELMFELQKFNKFDFKKASIINTGSLKITKGETPLFLASINGHTEIVESLLKEEVLTSTKQTRMDGHRYMRYLKK